MNFLHKMIIKILDLMFVEFAGLDLVGTHTAVLHRVHLRPENTKKNIS